MNREPSVSATAQRMRRFRSRHRSGTRSVRVALNVTQIDLLIHMGYLEADHRDDRNKIQRAVEILLSDTFGQMAPVSTGKRDA